MMLPNCYFTLTYTNRLSNFLCAFRPCVKAATYRKFPNVNSYLAFVLHSTESSSHYFPLILPALLQCCSFILCSFFIYKEPICLLKKRAIFKNRKGMVKKPSRSFASLTLFPLESLLIADDHQVDEEHNSTTPNAILAGGP